MSWRERAACIGLDHLFFVDRGNDGREAMAICRGCEVRAQCLSYALTADRPLLGIWGGTTFARRRELRRSMRRRVA